MSYDDEEDTTSGAPGVDTDTEWTRTSSTTSRRPDAKGPPKNAKRYVVWLLSRREYSEKELRDRLTQKGCAAVDIDDAVGFARKHDLQSDVRFTESKVRSRAGLGNSRIRQELRQSGIGVEAVSEALASLNETAPERERAIAAARRFLGKPLDDKLRAKAFRFLASRGFSGDAVRAAMASLAAI